MESEFMQMIDKYAGKHARLLFFIFAFAILFSIVGIPFLVNLRTIWDNVEWAFNRMGIASFFGRVVGVFLIVILSFMILRLLSILVAFTIRLAYATPIHWRIDNTLSKIPTLIQRLSVIANNTNQKEEIAKLSVETEAIIGMWNSSRITRLVRWIVMIGEKRRGEK